MVGRGRWGRLDSTSGVEVDDWDPDVTSDAGRGGDAELVGDGAGTRTASAPLLEGGGGAAVMLCWWGVVCRRVYLPASSSSSPVGGWMVRKSEG